MTHEEILDRMLADIPNEVDKREGSLAFDVLSAAAIEFLLAYGEDEMIMTETYADSASMDGLIKRASERGLQPNAPTNAIVKGSFNIAVAIGERFFLNDLTYIVTEQISDTTFKLMCEQPGTIANGYTGTIIPIQAISGLESAEITEILVLGEDEQSEDSFRQEYFDSFNNNQYGWNKAQYIASVNDINGVGGVHVYAHTNGNMESEAGNVALVIQASDYGVPTTETVNLVKQTLDPTDGNGDGLVSIDHNVHVFPCGSTSVDIGLTLTYATGYSWEEIGNTITKAIDDYILELNKGWETTAIIVRISQLDAKILDVQGVVDITGTTLNGETKNLEISADNIAVRGNISAN